MHSPPDCGPDHNPRESSSSALPAGAILLPGLAALTSITLYLVKTDVIDLTGDRAYGLGTAIAVAAWRFLSPVLLRRYAFVDRSNPAAYAQLVEVYAALRLRAECLVAEADNRDRCAVHEACRHLAYVGRELGLSEERPPSSGLRWLLATGYVDLWRRLHRAEEALILAQPAEQLVGDAVFDDLRLDGSPIAGAGELRNKLRLAVSQLDAEATHFLNPPPAGLEQQKMEAGGHDRDAHVAAARGVLRSIRRTINDFRDDRREGLVRSRNNLYATVLFAGLVAYLVLGLAMVYGVSRQAVVAGAAFYLVGALVGLFRQLRAASLTGPPTEEDYGLSTARLIHTPLFSGLAGVAGAALVKVLPALTTTITDAKTTLPQIKLDNVFNLVDWPQGLIWAAVFGLTPTLLISSLQRGADLHKEQLKATKAGEGAAKESS